MSTASTTLTWSFIALTLILAAAFVDAIAWTGRHAIPTPPNRRRTLATAAALTLGWLALTGGLAAMGWLGFEVRRPTMLPLLVGSIGLAIGLGTSAVGRSLATTLPLAVLVGFQGFRIAVEWLLARAWREGLAPVQMTYHGRNFDIVTGVTAVALAALLARRTIPEHLVPRLLRAWNLLGIALLANVLTIALLSAPTPLRVFHNEPANVWITHAPWVWLPTVMVVAAALGHVLVARRLRAMSHAARPLGHTPAASTA